MERHPGTCLDTRPGARSYVRFRGYGLSVSDRFGTLAAKVLVPMLNHGAKALTANYGG